MNDKEKRLVDISVLTGVSNWLTELPITEFGLELSKQQFWDSIRLQVSGNEGNRYFSTFSGFRPQRFFWYTTILLVHFYTYGVFNQW